jgi:hypothetical protein
MSTVNGKPFSGGDTPAASELNQPYDDVASSVVDGVNTGKEWVTRGHLNDSGTVFSKTFYDYYDGTTVFTTSSTSPVIIDNTGANPRTINTNYTAENDVLVRVQADGIVGELTCETPFSTATSNLYQFDVLITYNTSSTMRICYGNYTFKSYALNPTAPTTALSAKIWPMYWRNWAITGIATFPAGTVINSVSLRCKVGDAANVLNVERNNLFVLIAEN